MSFVNSYKIKDEYHSNHFASEFLEGNRPFILSLANSTSVAYPLITSLNLDGSIRWERTIKLEGDPNIKIELINVISAYFENAVNSYQYIIHCKTDDFHFLTSIDSLGNSLWTRILDTESKYPNCVIASDKTSNKPFILVSDNYDIEVDAFAHIGIIDQDGEISNAQQFSRSNGESIFDLSMIVQEKEIIVTGSTIYQDDISPVTVSLNYALEQVSDFFLIKEVGKGSSTIRLTNTILIHSFIDKDSNPVLCLIGENNVEAIQMPLQYAKITQLASNGDDGFYYLESDGFIGSIWAFDKKMRPLWNKRIEARSNNNYNHLNNFTLSQRKTHFTLTSTYLEESHVLRTDRELNSCITSVITNELEKPKFIKKEKIGLGAESAELKTRIIEVTLKTFTSDAKTLCGVSGNTLNLSNSRLQSPFLNIIAAGSDGSDSTPGIHTRWSLDGYLGDMHLPKGNFSNNTDNFNKADDYVKIYRGKYTPAPFTLDLKDTTPIGLDGEQTLIYREQGKQLRFVFKNVSAYNNAKSLFDPIINTLGFMESYGSNIIEIHSDNHLFFNAKLTGISFNQNTSVQVEVLSVADSSFRSGTFCSATTVFSDNFDQMSVRLENGRTLAYLPSNTTINEIEFEFYSDHLETLNNNAEWEYLNRYSVTENSSIAFERLEPYQGVVNARWQKFNGDQFVNVENYKTRFEGNTDPENKDIQTIVKDYLNLSEAANNPTATESILINGDPQNTVEISNLDVLNLAAMDYHNARMLGLGHLDLDPYALNGSFFI